MASGFTTSSAAGLSLAIPPQHPSDAVFCTAGTVSCVISRVLLNADNRSATRRRGRDQHPLLVSKTGQGVASETTQLRGSKASISAPSEDAVATNLRKAKASESHLKPESSKVSVTAIQPFDAEPEIATSAIATGLPSRTVGCGEIGSQQAGGEHIRAPSTPKVRVTQGWKLGIAPCI